MRTHILSFLDEAGPTIMGTYNGATSLANTLYAPHIPDAPSVDASVSFIGIMNLHSSGQNAVVSANYADGSQVGSVSVPQNYHGKYENYPRNTMGAEFDGTMTITGNNLAAIANHRLWEE